MQGVAVAEVTQAAVATVIADAAPAVTTRPELRSARRSGHDLRLQLGDRDKSPNSRRRPSPGGPQAASATAEDGHRAHAVDRKAEFRAGCRMSATTPRRRRRFGLAVGATGRSPGSGHRGRVLEVLLGMTYWCRNSYAGSIFSWMD